MYNKAAEATGGLLPRFERYAIPLCTHCTISSFLSKDGHELMRNYLIPSMHSSRIRIARLLAVCPSMHCAGGVSGPGGCLLPGGVSAPGWGEGSATTACTEADPPSL